MPSSIFHSKMKCGQVEKRTDDKFHIQIEANFVSWRNNKKNYSRKNQSKFKLNHFKNKKATLRHLTIINIHCLLLYNF